MINNPISVSLKKGLSISLDKDIETYLIGAHWDERVSDGVAFDLDLMLLCLDENGFVTDIDDFFFHGTGKAQGIPRGQAFTGMDGAFKHNGDNLVGGDGDSEQIIVDTQKIRSHVKSIKIVYAIHDAEVRKQNFGLVSNPSLRIADASSGKGLVHYDIAETSTLTQSTAMVAGVFKRTATGWDLENTSEPCSGGLVGLLAQHGISAS